MQPIGGIRVLFAALCLAGPVFIAVTTPAHACSCGPTTLEEQVQGASLIVTGQVRDLRFVEDPPRGPTAVPGVTPPPLLSNEGAEVAWTFVVEEYIKGSGPAEIEIHSGAGVTYDPDGTPRVYPGTTTVCGFAPEDGGRYLFVLGDAQDGAYFTGACATRTELSGDATEFIDRIRAILAAPPVDGFPDTGAGPPDAGSSAPSLALAAAVGSALAGAVLLSPLAWRRLRR